MDALKDLPIELDAPACTASDLEDDSRYDAYAARRLGKKQEFKVIGLWRLYAVA